MADIPPSNIVNKAAIGQLLDISESRVNVLIREGMPVYQRGVKGKPTLFNLSEVIAWQKERARNEHLKKKGGRPRSKPTEQDADTKSDKPDPRNRLREIDVELKEFELAKAKREWVRIDEVMQLAAEQFADARVTLLNVAGECGRKYGKQIEAFVREKILEAMRKITIDQTPYIAKEEE
jgi:phage terminase Nu1 subunit (DNA packaging protein)